MTMTRYTEMMLEADNPIGDINSGSLRSAEKAMDGKLFPDRSPAIPGAVLHFLYILYRIGTIIPISEQKRQHVCGLPPTYRLFALRAYELTTWIK